MLGILGWIVFGLIAGALAKLVMPGRDPGGILVTMMLGIAGALVAGFLGKVVGLVWCRRAGRLCHGDAGGRAAAVHLSSLQDQRGVRASAGAVTTPAVASSTVQLLAVDNCARSRQFDGNNASASTAAWIRACRKTWASCPRRMELRRDRTSMIGSQPCARSSCAIFSAHASMSGHWRLSPACPPRALNRSRPHAGQ